jgi:hypothetical protein
LFFVITWDASPEGWAALLRWWGLIGGEEQLCEELFVGSWPDGEDVSQQPYRECLAGALAVEASIQRAPLGGRCGIARNDAAAAISALRKGSTQSAVMQRYALRADRACATADIDLLPWHVPGLTLIAEGIDGASRGGDHFGDDANLDSVLGPAVRDELWARIQQAVEACGLRATVDAFATESNRRCDRFWSRFGEPGSEAVDALSVPDWKYSRCPACGALHREVVYAFPPLSSIRPAIKKATADGATIVLVVPVAIIAPLWARLVRCSILPHSLAPDGFVRIRSPGRQLRCADNFAPKELAVFVCDFTQLSTRSALAASASCGGFFSRRGRPLCGSARDFADRARLREALLARRDPRWTRPVDE